MAVPLGSYTGVFWFRRFLFQGAKRWKGIYHKRKEGTSNITEIHSAGVHSKRMVKTATVVGQPALQGCRRSLRRSARYAIQFLHARAVPSPKTFV